MRYNLIVPCGGKGVRCGLDYNKLFYKNKDGLMLIEKTLDLFLKDKNCTRIILSINDDKNFFINEILHNFKVLNPYFRAMHHKTDNPIF